jgi:DNA-directed RNA polymerase III subunit RPC4
MAYSLLILEKRPEFMALKTSGASGSSRSAASGPNESKTVKKEGVTSSRGDYTSSTEAQAKNWHPDPQYPDEDLDAPRVDIELINLISDDSDDDPIFIGNRPKTNGKGKSTSKGGLKPVRLHRQEHKERVTLVNTEPMTKLQPDSDEELPTIDELRSSRAVPGEKEFQGVYQDIVEEARIKAEPGVELSFRGSPPPPASSPESKSNIKSLTYLPESKTRTKDQVSSSLAIDLEQLDEEALAKAKNDKKSRRLGKKKDKKPIIQTEEDRAEYERHLEDVAILANELGGLQGNLSANTRDAEGDIAMDGGVAEEADKKEGRLYLFQFPPVVPELYNPIKGKPKTKVEIKAEKEKEKVDKDMDVQMTGMSAKGKGKMKERIDLTGDATVVKIEEEAAVGPDGKPEKEEKKKRDEVVHEEGWIGKLIVRESGRVELCWGGTNLLVGRGVDAGFLTTGVMVDMIERGPPGGGAPEGKALSMGQVMGKFVVTPDWEKMV